MFINCVITSELSHCPPKLVLLVSTQLDVWITVSVLFQGETTITEQKTQAKVKHHAFTAEQP